MATINLLYLIQLNVCNFFYFSQTEPSQNNEISKQPEANGGAEVSQQTEVNQQTGVNQHSDKQKLEIGEKKKRKTSVEKSIELVIEQFKAVIKEEFERYSTFHFN